MEYGEKEIKRETIKHYKRDIIIDVGQTGMGKTVWAKNYIKTQKRVIVLDPQDEYSYFEFESAKELLHYVNGKRLFRVKHTDIRDFPLLCFGITFTPNSLLVVEESQKIISPLHKLPEEFEDLVYRGRHSGTSLLLIAQRASTINIAVRSQYSQMIVFRQTEKSDLKWIEDVTGYDKIGEQIKNLGVLEYIHFTNTGYEVKKLNKFS